MNEYTHIPPPSMLRDDPAISTGHLLVWIEASAEHAMENHVVSEPSTEVCGVLVGMHGENAEGPFTYVTRAIEGKHADQRSASVTFTHDTWDYIHEVLADEDGPRDIVGWYHSHPGFGVFYSSHDCFIQQNFFGQAWQVGVVLDPSDGSRGVFVNTQKGVRGLPTYRRGNPVSTESDTAVTCLYRYPIVTAASDSSESPAQRLAVTDSLRLIAIEQGVTQLRRDVRRLQFAALSAGALVVGTLTMNAWVLFDSTASVPEGTTRLRNPADDSSSRETPREQASPNPRHRSEVSQEPS